jgi:hypothetical protein
MLHLPKCFDLLPLGQAHVGMMDSAYFYAGWIDFMLPVSFMKLSELIWRSENGGNHRLGSSVCKGENLFNRNKSRQTETPSQFVYFF